MNGTDLCYLPAVELAAAIRQRELSAVEVTEAVLERIERLNPSLNAFALVLADEALAAAREADSALLTEGGPPARSTVSRSRSRI